MYICIWRRIWSTKMWDILTCALVSPQSKLLSATNYNILHYLKLSIYLQLIILAIIWYSSNMIAPHKWTQFISKKVYRSPLHIVQPEFALNGTVTYMIISIRIQMILMITLLIIVLTTTAITMIILITILMKKMAGNGGIDDANDNTDKDKDRYV